jgi:hypothetical protein
MKFQSLLFTMLVAVLSFAQVPTITSLSTYSANVGTTVTITGTGFSTTAANNVVYFGSVKATVSAATATSLTVTVPPSASNGKISYTNKSSLKSVISKIQFSTTFPGASSFAGSNFEEITQSIAPVNTTADATDSYAEMPAPILNHADFDSDGKVDLIIATGTGSGSASPPVFGANIYKNSSSGNGNFTLSSPIPITRTSSIEAVATGDLNFDGKFDVVLGSPTEATNSITVHINSTTGSTISFNAAINIASSNVNFIELADINSDGKIDVIFKTTANDKIYVSLNTSTNSSTVTFGSPTILITAANQAFEIADVDNDGDNDVLVASVSSRPKYFLNSSGAFPSTASFTNSAGNSFAYYGGYNGNGTLVDLDGDGYVDFAGKTDKNSFSRNTTSGSTITFGNATNVTCDGCGFRSSAAVDMDGDGDIDLIGGAPYSPPRMQINRNTSVSGTISFTGYTELWLGNAGKTMTGCAIDLDNNGRPDFIQINEPSTSASVLSIVRNKVGETLGIANQPSTTNQSLCLNVTATPLTVLATGISPTYQWEQSANGSTGWANVSAGTGATTTTFTPSTASAGTLYYRCKATDASGSVWSNASGAHTVTANNTAGTASSTPTLCVNTSLTNITHTTTGATGISAGTNLPAGVTAAWSANTITISGTPTASGTFNYSIPLTGGCGSVNATGTITVTPALSAGTASSTPGVCDGSSMTAVTHTTTGATGFGYPTGLPAGMSLAYSNNTLTISGSPSNTYNVGDYYNGGRIAYIFQPNDNGYVPGKVIIVDPVYKSVATCWTFGSQTATTSALIGEGLNNTNNLYNAGHTSNSQTIGYAYAYTDGVYSDWFIPSQNELNAILTNMPTSYFQWNSGFYIRSSTRANTTQTFAYRRGGSNIGIESNNQNDGGCANTIIARYDILPTPSSVQTFNYTIPLTGSCGTASATGTITITDSYTWTGATSTDPTVAGNWNPAAVPCSGANEVIPSGLTNYPAYTNLSINSGTTFTVQSGAKLDISGVLTNNGTLTIESGATLVQGASSTLAGSGTYNVKQTITGAGSTTPTGRFWYLGSPVSLASSSVYFGNAANVVKKRDESTNAWITVASGTPENLVVGKGYYTQAMANSTINFTGGLVNNGAITINGLSRTAGQGFEGFNLVSNPYPSYLNWDAVTKTNVDGTIWYRTHDGSNMVFDTYVANAAGGIGTNLSGNTATKYIPPMQSFWVRVSQGQTTGSLTLGNAMRSHFASLGSSTAGLRSTNDEQKLFIRMNLLQANKKDQIIVYVNETATNGFDVLDGEKMMQAGMPQFYTSAAGKKITINGLNSAKKQQALPITMELPTTGVHSFVIEDLEISNGLVWLEDKQEEIMQALEPGTVYEFYANSGINAERFVLHFQLIDNTTPINVYNEVNGSANFSGKGASVHAESAGVVVIKLPAITEGITDIQIRDAAGRLVYTGSTNTLETSVQLAQANGIYYVTLNSASGVEVRKVFIQQ